MRCCSKKHKELESEESTGGDGFGAKKITWFGGFCLLFNNITGPGMVVLQVSYQEGGWFSSTATLILCLFMSGLSCGYLIRAMAHVSGNEEFQGRVEYTPLCKAVFPRWLYLIAMVSFLAVIQASNVSSIIEGAQILDLATLNIAKHTCGLKFYAPAQKLSAKHVFTNFGPINCVEKLTPNTNATDNKCDPTYDCVFGSNWFGVSPGLVVTALVSIPMGYVNLDENIWFQVLSAIVLMIICIEWFIQFGDYTLDLSQVMMFKQNQVYVFGVIMFNFQFVTTIPSWLNEKKEGVGVNSSIWWSVVLSALLYIGLGYFGAVAKGLNFDTGNALYTELLGVPIHSVVMHTLTRVMVYLFYITLISGIPVYSIIVRYNLLQEGFPSKFWANMIAVVLPFVVSIFFYGGSAIDTIMTWVGFIFTAPLNFMIPAYLYILTQRRQGAAFFKLDKQFISAIAVRRCHSEPAISSITALTRPVKAASRSWSGAEMSKALSAADPTLSSMNTFLDSLRKPEDEKSLIEMSKSKYGAAFDHSDDDDDDNDNNDSNQLCTQPSGPVAIHLCPVPYEPVPESCHWVFKEGMAWCIIVISLIISVVALVLQLKQYVEDALHPKPLCVPNNMTDY